MQQRDTGIDLQSAVKRTRNARLEERFRNTAQVMENTAFDLARDGLATDTGWRGWEPTGLSKRKIIGLWKSGKIADYLVRFYRASCLKPERPLVLADQAGRAFLLRATTARFCIDLGIGKEFVKANLKFAKSVAGKEKPKGPDGVRGPHEPIIVGIHREYSDTPLSTSFENAHQAETDELAASESMKRICGFITKLLRARFPGVALRYQNNITWHWKHNRIRPKFGLFWNYCFNAMYAGQKRVHCGPHSDSKNIVGICAVMVYEMEDVTLPEADFDYSKKSWLCIWDAGIIIELRPWQVVLYPSSLMYHFNVDVDAIDIITTGGERPTRENPASIQGGKDYGRGSVVFFNQATMFHCETGSATIKVAKSRGHSGATDFVADVDHSFPVLTQAEGPISKASKA
ncbi:hypothetical protein BDN72DRAFT_864607 [Pluteus cervinus]|uniref:Uncharacterized protein n=1 Tax=Pluteus cervinus TaxID=181527 RepID=A0ACD3A2P0_9AGAR|nr:hypothetical protein BDN72DRAFT_864607 [Pluteus cervinus]